MVLLKQNKNSKKGAGYFEDSAHQMNFKSKTSCLRIVLGHFYKNT